MGFYITNSMMTDEAWEQLAKPQIKDQLNGYHPSQYTLDMYNKADGPDHLSKILYTDIKTYMTGDILVKVDRMSMAHSLEVRAPILDYQVTEFAATLPSSQRWWRCVITHRRIDVSSFIATKTEYPTAF